MLAIHWPTVRLIGKNLNIQKHHIECDLVSWEHLKIEWKQIQLKRKQQSNSCCMQSTARTNTHRHTRNRPQWNWGRIKLNENVRLIYDVIANESSRTLNWFKLKLAIKWRFTVTADEIERWMTHWWSRKCTWPEWNMWRRVDRYEYSYIDTLGPGPIKTKQNYLVRSDIVICCQCNGRTVFANQMSAAAS